MATHDGKILEKIFNSSGLTQAEFAGVLGISRNHFITLKSKEIIDKKYKDSIEKKFKIKFDEVKTDALIVEKKAHKQIPYYDIDAIGGDVKVFQEDGNSEYITGYIDLPSFKDCDVALNVAGISMIPIFNPGEIILCKLIKDKEVIQYGEAYLIITAENRFIKYIKKGPTNDVFRLVSHNEVYEDFEIPKKKILHLYLIKGRLSKMVL